MKIVAIVTCFNRCDKSIKCLQSLYSALGIYNHKSSKKLTLEVYLTDDGCTDNTVQQIEEKIMPLLPVTIIKGNGNLYWAGGMRAAWKEALKRKDEWDYYFLINDDVVFFENTFDELFNAEKYAIETFGKQGMYSGITCDIDNPNIITYSGRIRTNKLLGTKKQLVNTGTPQSCWQTNANILLVHKSVVDEIGIFYEGYQHTSCDYDYSVTAYEHKFPVLVTGNVCGACEFDHKDRKAEMEHITKMSLKERKAFLTHPIRNYKDDITYSRRHTPFRTPLVWSGKMIRLYFPRFYQVLDKIRFYLKGDQQYE